VLESLAGCCTLHGLPVRAVAWGLWKDTGMGSSVVSRPTTSTSAGLHALPMSPQSALAALELLPPSPPRMSATVVAIADVDWHLLGSPDRSPSSLRISLWKSMTDSQAHQRNPTVSATRSATSLTPQDVESLLHRLLCEVLAIDERTSVPEDLILAELGMDSMGGMELRASLAQRTGLWLPLRTFRAPTKRTILDAYKALPTPTPSDSITTSSLPAIPVKPRYELKPQQRFKWLDYIGGDQTRAAIRLICFSDAGGDPANFGSWVSMMDTQHVELWVIHWPHHTTRSEEDSCKSIQQGASFMLDEIREFLQEKPYAFFGQCIGAYYAFRYIEEFRALAKVNTFFFFFFGIF